MGIAKLDPPEATQWASRFECIVTGDQPWGWSRATGACHGVYVREIEVYPPGTGVGQRWLLAVDRVAPAIGGLIGLAVALVLGADGLAGFGFAVAAAGAFTALTHWLTRRIRRRVGRIGVVRSVPRDAPGIGRRQ
ncbi:hypothetical protein GCM10009785_30050 [Brooklawnia cerclae]|uniref:VIT1/CCC1 family predicted Fe2+/Mn2+ transporter n=1 Tax=Brooklawnia cerclae TaxID=349934 RepID=A0ABX0SE91_9ACTN|nr:VIT1/CCC1 family predicted Fe2+/Mn2+ transporter [Brooklawnia cerclae]